MALVLVLIAGVAAAGGLRVHIAAHTRLGLQFRVRRGDLAQADEARGFRGSRLARRQRRDEVGPRVRASQRPRSCRIQSNPRQRLID